MRRPDEVAAEYLGLDHVDEYETELVLAGMRECYDALDTAQRALATVQDVSERIRSALIEVENALDVLEER